ncbi:hypothetical protein MMC29_004619 [Sticta canariensis]|nr:hypothetical protein [Sticta canariensis]
MPPRKELVTITYQGQQLTESQVIRHLQQISSPTERYDAAVKIRDLAMDAHEQGGRFLARLYDYITKDGGAWIHTGQQAFERDWVTTKEVASQSNATQQRCTATRQTIFTEWGEALFAPPTLPLDLALLRLNRARIARRNQALASHRRWKFDIQAIDYEKALHLEGIPEITQLDLDLAEVYVDDAGMLRQKPPGG